MDKVGSSIKDNLPDASSFDERGSEFQVLNSFLHKAAIPIIICKDVKIFECNTKALELFGGTRDEMIGSLFFDLSPERQADGSLSSEKSLRILERVKGEEPVVVEWVYQRLDGTRFVSRVSINTFTLHSVWYVAVFMENISDFKRNIDELYSDKNNLNNLLALKKEELTELNRKLLLTVEKLNANNAELAKTNEELSETLKDLNREVFIRKKLHELLISNQEKFKNFIDQSTEGIAIIDSNLTIVEWNRSLSEITGISSTEAINRKVYDIDYLSLPEALRSPQRCQGIKDEMEHRVKELLERQEAITIEEEIQHTSGELRYISVVLFQVKLSKNFLIGRLVRDVTQFKVVEKELKRYRETLEENLSEKSVEISKISDRYLEIFNNTSDGIAIVSSDFKLIQANPALEKMLIRKFDELTIIDFFDNVPKNYHSVLRSALKMISQGQIPKNIEVEFINSLGKIITVELSANFIDYHKEKAIISIIRDISERREMEKLILRTTIEAEERERKRLAADLHDDIGPLLASLNMYVSILQQRLRGSSSSDVIETIMNLIKSSIENVRTISNNISPHLIERYGLISAIVAEIENYKMLLPIILNTDIEGLRFTGQVEIIIYRIIKELINNTLKYANASRVDLTIKYRQPKLLIDYADDGVGFDLETLPLAKDTGHGLTNIDSRIRSINGNYSIESSKGRGILFKLEIPVPVK